MNDGEKIISFLKNPETSARISNGDRWLYWDEDSLEWVVLYCPPYAKKVKTLYRGNDLSDALKYLSEE